MNPRVPLSVAAFVFAAVATLPATAQWGSGSQSQPPVSPSDVRIVQRAREILNSPKKWNRADDRDCPASETTYSLYCALEKATCEVTHSFAHRGAAMQESRFVIDDDLVPGNNYYHRLMDYNNDPATTFADVQRFFDLLQGRIEGRLEGEEIVGQLTKRPPQGQQMSAVTQADIEIVQKVEAMLDSPAGWDRASSQHCKADAQTFGLYCAFKAASTAVTGNSHYSGPAMQEARQVISTTAPNAAQYRARLVD
jgi:hypothetical protein